LADNPGKKWAVTLLVGFLFLFSVWGYEFVAPSLHVHAAYTVANSARFVSGNSDYLSKTLTTPTNNKIWTFSAWVKRSGFANYMEILRTTSGASTEDAIRFHNSDAFQFYMNGATAANLISNPLFRDPAAWMHIVVAVDSTQATASNRVKIYINGTQLTSFSTAQYPSQNASSNINSAIGHAIGSVVGGGSEYFDGYLSDVYFIDGQALAPTAFGQTDANGYWRPIAYAGTYGTNGFHLAFGNGSSLGTDTSGNGNNWTVNNLTANDQMLDTPTNSFATLDVLTPIGSATNLGTATGGNLTFANTSANYAQHFGNISQSSGKWYYEVTINTISNNLSLAYGICKLADYPAYNGTAGSGTGCVAEGDFGDSYLRQISESSGQINASHIAGTTFSAGDVLMVAYDVAAGKYWLGKNGTWFDAGSGAGVPASGTNPTQTFTANINWKPWGLEYGNTTNNVSFNFGQGGQSGLTFDAASGGNFKYTPPAGFKALDTANLPVPAIAVPKNYFDAVTYTGTGAALPISPQFPSVGTQTVVTLTSSGTWTVPAGVTSVSVLAVGGGGGGGGGVTASTVGSGGGGGGGGVVYAQNYPVTPGAPITVTVGAGGVSGGAANGSNGGAGGNSVFDALTALGGGGGGSYNGGSVNGTTGGSGGGAGQVGGANAGSASTQTNFGVGIGYGSAGGAASGSASWGDGGGGGAGGVGTDGTGSTGGNGGTGKLASSLNPNFPSNYYGGGGGGGTHGATAGSGGAGGGGNGSTSGTGSAGTANTGGGGGGGGNPGGTSNSGGVGGSGVILVGYSTGSNSLQPDLVWIKDRTTTNAHGIFDSVRTATKYWSSNANTAETTSATSLTAFLTNGFSLGTNSLFNTSGNNYISWLWKKCPAISGSCLGADGVDIVTYTGDNTANKNISHSLGAAPDMVIVKRRDSTGDPFVWTSSLAGATSFLLLDSTAAVSTTNTPWGTGNFSSTQFMVSANATNNANAISSGAGGSQTFNASGTFTVPTYTSLTVTVTGAGGGGGGGGDSGCDTGDDGDPGGSGGNSSFNSNVVGNGGGGGGGGIGYQVGPYSGGAGGSGGASGGDTNTTGGGAGGGGGGTDECGGGSDGGPGGTGGKAVKTYSLGAFTPGNSISVVVGTGGPGGGGLGTDGADGANGSVAITWTTSGMSNNYVAYLFKSIPGFSAFGTYTGNGSADGPFVFTNFKPRYVMVKRTDSTSDWTTWDSARNTYNPTNNHLEPDDTSAEDAADSNYQIDILSNGFKLRGAGAGVNTSGGTYIYAAFADVPFKYSAGVAPTVFTQATSFLLGMTY
jgi:hypothetical protein